MNHNKPITLSPHLTQFIHIQGLEAAKDLQQQRQSHSYLSRRYGQNEHEHYLAVSLMPPGAGYHECQSRCVEHDLKRHQDEN